MNSHRLLALCVLACGVAFHARAQTVFTWTGLGDGKLTSAANWLNNVAPTSSATNTALEFPLAFRTWVELDTDFDVQAISFTGTSGVASYSLFGSSGTQSLGIGAGGVTVAAPGEGGFRFASLPRTRLLANQTWQIGGAAMASAEVSGTAAITKTGPGALILGGQHTFSGGLDHTAGTITLNTSSIVEGVSFLSGPLGTGPITIRGGATLSTGAFSDVLLANAIGVHSGAIFSTQFFDTDFILNGAVTLQTAGTTQIEIVGEEPVQFFGAIGQASAGTTLRLSGGGLALLAGNNSYTGATIVDGSGVVFATEESLSSTITISSVNGGHVSVAFNGGMTTVLNKISDKNAFAGSLGFETPPSSETPITFTDDLSTLDGFNPESFGGIGTFSTARLTGAINAVGSNYKFGGGNGTLFVASNLTDESAGVLVSSNTFLGDTKRLTLYLQGSNTFTGSVVVSTANVIFDSAGALPSGARIELDSHGYAGYTQAATNLGTFADFIGKIDFSTGSSVVGIDTNIAEARSFSEAIDLSGFEMIYFGTATRANISGTLTAPADGTLALTGVNGGYLRVTSQLAASNVTAVKLGLTGSGPFAHHGIVQLDSGSSNYIGATAFENGYLVLGASSIFDGGIISGPIGKGTLEVPMFATPNLIAGADGIALHNNINLAGGSTLRVGVPQSETEDVPSELFQFDANSLTLSGIISGAGAIAYSGNDSTLTLDAANTFSGGFQAGGFETLVIANNNSAFGAGPLDIDYATVRMTTAAPAIGSLKGDGGTIELTAATPTLQINQASGEWFYGSIVSSNPVTIVKSGTANLFLGGNSTYSGTTRITAGSITAGSGMAFGSSVVELAGGSLILDHVTLPNTLSFTSPSRITGVGSFGAAFSAGTNVTIAPGASPGILTFENGLTFGNGGTLELEIISMNGEPGIGYDALSITGDLTFAGNDPPFKINLLSLASSGSAGPVFDFDSSSSYSLQIATVTGSFVGSASTVMLNATGFLNNLNGGTFSLATSGNSLLLNFTAVPEPSTWALLFAGAATLALSLRRPRRKQGLVRVGRFKKAD